MKKCGCMLLVLVMLLVSCADAASDDAPVSGDTLATAAPMVETETALEEIDWGETEVEEVIPPEEVMVVEPDPPPPSEYIGQIECLVHSMDYHSYPDVFIEYVGSDAFNEWLQSREKRYEDCAFNDGFPYFIRDFGITEETYYQLHEDTISAYRYDHPAELIFHGTEEEIEAYYRDLEGNRVRSLKNQYIDEFKHFLAEKADSEIENLRTTSIEEIYRATSMTEDELSDFIRDFNSRGDGHRYHISMDLIFTAESELDIFVEAPPEGKTEAPSADIEWGEPEEVVVVEPIG